MVGILYAEGTGKILFPPNTPRIDSQTSLWGQHSWELSTKETNRTGRLLPVPTCEWNSPSFQMGHSGGHAREEGALRALAAQWLRVAAGLGGVTRGRTGRAADTGMAGSALQGQRGRNRGLGPPQSCRTSPDACLLSEKDMYFYLVGVIAVFGGIIQAAEPNPI